MQPKPTAPKDGLQALTVGEYRSFLALLTKCLSADLARAMLADDDILRASLEAGEKVLCDKRAADAHERASRIAWVKNLFREPAHQLDVARRLNGSRGPWKFSDRDFGRAARQMPVWTPTERLVAPVLVPRLVPSDQLLPLLWKDVCGEYYDSVRRQEQMDPLKAFSIYPEPTDFEPHLSWEWIDFEADRGGNVLADGPGTFCDANLLAAVILHPGWLLAMDGKGVPFVHMAAYRVTEITERESGRRPEHVPTLTYEHLLCSPSNPLRPHLSAYEGEAAGDSRWAFPRRLPGPP